MNGNKTILLVDDIENDRLLMRDAFKKSNFNWPIQEALDGIGAHAHFTELVLDGAKRRNRPAELAPLVRVAGGRVTTIAGADSRFDDLQKIASNGHIHDELLRLLEEIAL